MKLITLLGDIIAIIGILLAVCSIIYMAFVVYVPLGFAALGIALAVLGIMMGGYIR